MRGSDRSIADYRGVSEAGARLGASPRFGAATTPGGSGPPQHFWSTFSESARSHGRCRSDLDHGVERPAIRDAFEFVLAAVGKGQFAADDEVAGGA